MFRQSLSAFEDLVMSDDESVDGDLGPLLVQPAQPDGVLEWRPVPADLTSAAVQDFYHSVPGHYPLFMSA